MNKNIKYYKIDFDKIDFIYGNLNKFCLKNEFFYNSFAKIKREKSFISEKNKNFKFLKENKLLKKEIYFLEVVKKYTIKKD